ncbi:MAG: hypothetical protein JST75_03820 [Bacteroidetes bacterium]|nr:hypothetical protein [Bacteroidota bacterium]
MKAFISYSLNDQEQYIATLLSYRLREQGFSLILNSNFQNEIDITTTYQMFSTQLFVGLISYNGAQWNRVLQEYEIALSNNIPAILLIEENVIIAPNFQGNFVRFNRSNPHPAIEEIRRRMSVQRPAGNEGLGWILGGAALLAIIALLSNGGKK